MVRKAADTLPIRVWTEIVDDEMMVGNASCFVIRRGEVYGFSVFVLVNVLRDNEPRSWWVEQRRTRRKAEEVARERFMEVFKAEHDHVLPFVARLRDLNSVDGVDFQW